jgi:outer membrane protein, heavy metal efflux system
MRSRRLLIAVFSSLFFQGRASAEPPPLVLSDVLREARERNPDVAAARRRWETASARVSPGRTLPDPMVGVSRETFSGADMDRLMFRQDVPFPGKLRSEGNMLYHEAQAAEADYKAKALEVHARAKIGYYRLFRADQLVRRLEGDVELMRAALRAVRARFGAGSQELSSPAAGEDVFGLMAELGKMENMLLQETQERRLASIELNTLLSRDPGAEVGTPAGPALVDVPRSLEELLDLARANDPMYHKALHEERHSRSRLSRARLGFLPDIGLAYDRISAGGRTGKEVSVSLTVPLWLTRPLGELKSARAHSEEAAASAEAMRNEVVRMVSSELVETRTHLSLARNYESTILPSAEGALKLARRRYESGAGDFLRLIEALRTYLSAQFEYFNEVYHYAEHWAMLEQWVGVPLEGKP